MDNPSDPEDTARVHRLANGLRRAAALLVVSCVVGLGTASGVTCYFLLTLARPLSGCDTWEALLAGGGGMLLGLGISLPFFILFRLQAELAEMDVRSEGHALEAKARAAQTARSINEIAQAGMSGEWRISSFEGTAADIGPEQKDPS
jgi:hypothetical protein